jgi:hypothetical protein
VSGRAVGESTVHETKIDGMKVDGMKIGAAIDHWLPCYQASASYSIFVRASPDQTYAALAQASLSDLPLVRRLMRLRGYRRARPTVPASNPQPPVRGHRLFLELAVLPPREVVLGIAGRFWRPDGGIVRDLTPADFLNFRRDGFAKAVWGFSLVAAADGTELTTETRVQTFGPPATWKFRLYWLLVGPFSGLMRRAMLREIKRIAESSSS